MHIYATSQTKVVLSCLGIELIQREMLGTLNYSKPGQRNRCGNSSLAPADRAITPARINDATRKIELKHNRAAMTRCSVLGKNICRSDLLDHNATLYEATHSMQLLCFLAIKQFTNFIPCICRGCLLKCCRFLDEETIASVPDASNKDYIALIS